MPTANSWKDIFNFTFFCWINKIFSKIVWKKIRKWKILVCYKLKLYLVELIDYYYKPLRLGIQFDEILIRRTNTEKQIKQIYIQNICLSSSNYNLVRWNSLHMFLRFLMRYHHNDNLIFCTSFFPFNHLHITVYILQKLSWCHLKLLFTNSHKE